MTNEEMKEWTERVQEKIGKEASGLIADDIGLLISDTSKMNSDIISRNEEIEKLKDQKEKLIETNGNLLQQISMGDNSMTFQSRPSSKQIDEEEEVSISWKDCFDNKGNFLK